MRGDDIYTLARAEKRFCEWKHEKAIDFWKRLFDAIAFADETNLEKLRRGFPCEVTVWEMANKEKNYWEALDRIYCNNTGGNGEEVQS